MIPLSEGADPKVPSTLILDRLKHEARGRGRPEERLATLDRLVEACDAITGGSAADVVKRAGQANPSLKSAHDAYYRHGIPTLNPNRIDEYVRARDVLDALTKAERRVWTGPRGTTIRSDSSGLLAYVRAREQEQSYKAPVKEVRLRSVDEDVDLIADPVARQRVRFALEKGYSDTRELTIMKAGLREIPAVDLHALTADLPSLPAVVARSSPASLSSTPVISELSDADKIALGALVTKLMDSVLLSTFDLQFDRSRVRSRSTGDTLIEKAELDLLKRAAAYRPDDG